MNTNAPRRAALYLRISLDATGEGLAVERQRQACMAILAARGWTLAGEYVDNSVSASDRKKQRPGYDALVAAYDRGEFDAIVCYDLDRLTRQPRQLEDWIDAAAERGLALVTANGEADLTTDAGRLFARLKAAVARSEIERKSQRQKDANRQRATAGKPPVGLRLTGYTAKGDLIPAEAEIVRRIFAEFLNRKPMRGIVRALNDDAVPTRSGKPWAVSTVRDILTNPRYAGRAVYQGQVTGAVGEWVPLVTGEVFDTVQAILADPRRRTQRSVERRHLGAGLFVCGECGGRLSSWSGERYRCRAGGCFTRAIEPVDDYVTRVIAGRLAMPDLSHVLASRDADRSAPLLAEIETQRRKITRAESDYMAELIDGPLYKSIRDAAQAAIRAAETSLAAATASNAAGAVLSAPDPSVAFLGADLATRRAVIDLFAIVRVSPNARARSFDPDTVVIEWR